MDRRDFLKLSAKSGVVITLRPVKRVVNAFGFYHEYEGCTRATLGDVAQKLEKAGFERIVVHREISAICSNTVYIFCFFQEEKRGRAFVETVNFATMPLYSDDEFEFEPPRWGHNWTHKLIVGHRLLGYYNNLSNVLWLSDITHRYAGKAVLSELAEFVGRTRVEV